MPQITKVRTESTGTHSKHITAVQLADGTQKSRSTVVSEIPAGEAAYIT